MLRSLVFYFATITVDEGYSDALSAAEPAPTCTFSSAVQFANTELPMLDTLAGIVSFLSALQSWKT